MTRKYVTVTLTARVDGDDLVLLDANGKKIGHVVHGKAFEASPGTIALIETRREWRYSIRQMLACNAKRHIRSSATDWDRKISTWLSAVRFRRNRPEQSKMSHERRIIRWTQKRPDWEKAIRLMVCRNRCVVYRSVNRESSPWRVWTETVAANIKARRRRYEDYCAWGQADEV